PRGQSPKRSSSISIADETTVSQLIRQPVTRCGLAERGCARSVSRSMPKELRLVFDTAALQELRWLRKFSGARVCDPQQLRQPRRFEMCPSGWAADAAAAHRAALLWLRLAALGESVVGLWVCR